MRLRVWGLWRARLPDTHLYIAFLPTLPLPWLCTHFLRAFEYDSAGSGWLGLLGKAAPWGDPVWADAAFRRGEADARANLPELSARILEFLMT